MRLTRCFFIWQIHTHTFVQEESLFQLMLGKDYLVYFWTALNMQALKKNGTAKMWPELRTTWLEHVRTIYFKTMLYTT